MPDEVLALNYSRRDVQEMLEDIKDRVRAMTNDEWTDFLDSDAGYTILKSAVGLYDFNAFYTDKQAAEGFLSTCRYRESAIRHAKSHNYIPYALAAAHVEVTLMFPAFNQTFAIPADTIWKIDGKTFICEEIINIQPSTTELQITMRQGTRYSNSYTAPGTNWFKIQVPNTITNMVVKVDGVTYSPIDSFIDVSDPKSYKVYEDVGSTRTLLFGANYGTTRPASGAIITVKGINTLGDRGNTVVGNLPVYPAGTIYDDEDNDITNNFSGVTNTAALGGQDNESVQSIKSNAPLFYATQGRCVTADDFRAVVNRIPGIRQCFVIGGETVGKYGTVIIIVRGENPYTVSPDLIALVRQELKSKAIVTMNVEVQAPIIIEEAISIFAGLQRATYPTHSDGYNALNTGTSDFYDQLTIGENKYSSDLEAYLMGIGGFEYVNTASVITSFATSHAGAINIPVITNGNLATAVLKKNSDGTVLWSGNGASKVIDGYFKHIVEGLTDQRVDLVYKPDANDDAITSSYQLVVLKSLTIDTTLVD